MGLQDGWRQLWRTNENELVECRQGAGSWDRVFFPRTFSFLVGGFLGKGTSEALNFFLVTGQNVSGGGARRCWV